MKEKVIFGYGKGTFMDQNCMIEHEGQKFESGGAFIALNKKTGKLGGRVYTHCNPDKGVYEVSNWHGTIKIKASFGTIWTSNFGDRRRSVYFWYEGKAFYGMWCSIDFNELVSVREIKG